MYTDGILFDLDGTLWDSTELVADAWNEVIRKNTLLDLNLDGTRLKQLFGQLLPDIAAQIFPNCPKARQLELIDLCCQREHEVLSETCAPLYESLEQTLDELSNRFPLFIVSNCQAGYIETFLKTSHLEKYFKDHLCPGDTGEAKAHNIGEIIRRYNLSAPVYVGDTMGDYLAAKENQIPFVFASYGFGTVAAPDCTIEKPIDLVTIFSK